MTANWNACEIDKMTLAENLKNRCAQIEQGYVDWGRPATHNGFRISEQWPYIGECGRMLVNEFHIRFVTTTRRTIEVQTQDGRVLGKFLMKPGMAEALYACASGFVDTLR